MQDRNRTSLYPQPRQDRTARSTFLRVLLPVLVWVVIGAVAGLLLSRFRTSARALLEQNPGLHEALLTLTSWTTTLDLGTGHEWMLLTGFILSIWPHLLLHEAGHVLAGRLVGMRLYLVGLGPWRLQNMDGRWRFFRLRQVRGIGGFAAMLPTPGKPPARVGLMVFLLGGVAANLATAALLWHLHSGMDGPSALRALISGAFLQALFIAFMNLLPIASKGWLSDGRQLLMLLTRPQETLRYLVLQHLVGLSFAGIRPRDWPADVLPKLESGHAHDSSFFARVADLFHASWRLDSGHGLDDPDFWSRLAAHHAMLPDGYHQSVAVQMAEYATHHLHDADLLKAWLAHCEGGLLDLSPQRALFQAELALLESRNAALPELIAHARTLLPHASDPTTRLLLQERLDAMAASSPPPEQFHQDQAQ